VQVGGDVLRAATLILVGVISQHANHVSQLRRRQLLQLGFQLLVYGGSCKPA